MKTAIYIILATLIIFTSCSTESCYQCEVLNNKQIYIPPFCVETDSEYDFEKTSLDKRYAPNKVRCHEL